MAMRRAAARSGEWAQHFSNASCYKLAYCIVFMLLPMKRSGAFSSSIPAAAQLYVMFYLPIPFGNPLHLTRKANVYI